MADKKKLGDYMEVLLPAFGDQTAVIYRNDTSEEQWQMAKAAAKESGTLRTLKESERPEPKSKSASSDDTIELKDPMTGVVAKMPRGDISERRWKALKEQVAKGETKLDWQQNKEAGQAADEARAPAPAPTAAMPTSTSPNEVVKPKVTELPPQPSAVPGATQSHRTISGAGVTLTPDEPQASGPRKFFGDAMLGAIPGGTPDAGVSAPQIVAPSPIGVSGGAAPDAGVPAPPQGLSSPPPDASSGPMPNMGFGDPKPLTNPVDLAVAKGLPQASGTAPMSGGAPPAQPAPAPVDPNATGAKLGVQNATTTPGSGGSSLEGDLNRAYADQMRAKKEVARQEALQYTENAQLEVQKAKSLQIAEQARAAKAQAQLESQNQLIAAQMKVAESLSEQLKVDPKRLWANRTAEQKSNAQLAGFLFGLAGTGADYVRSLQQEVQKDVETQVQQFEANRASKVAQFNAYGNVFAQYLQQGLDAATSAKAANASILDVHAAKLKEIEARYQGTTAGARAADAAAALGVERVMAVNKVRDSLAQRVNLTTARELQKLDIEAKLEARKAKAAGGPALPATLKKEMADIQDSLANIDAMMSDASGGFFARGAVDAAGSIPGGGLVAPELRAKGRDYAGRAFTMMTNLARGALQPAEMEALGRIIPKEIKATEDPEPYLRKAREFLIQSLARRERDYANVGPDVRGPSAASNYGFNAE